MSTIISFLDLCARTSLCMCAGHRTTLVSLVSPPAIWILGIKLRSLSLAVPLPAKPSCKRNRLPYRACRRKPQPANDTLFTVSEN